MKKRNNIDNKHIFMSVCVWMCVCARVINTLEYNLIICIFYLLDHKENKIIIEFLMINSKLIHKVYTAFKNI